MTRHKKKRSGSDQATPEQPSHPSSPSPPSFSFYLLPPPSPLMSLNLHPPPPQPSPPQPLPLPPAVSDANEYPPLPRFRALPAEGRTSYAAILALQKTIPDINIPARPTHRGEFTITPKDRASVDLLKANTAFQLLNPSERLNKAIIINYPVDPFGPSAGAPS
ncbi:uncharacterized protein [Macrobrachium rosenbergii]|uniref:uncharacterized protein n=1 Tax=Macrobrachium rosenbergii TaxID=79674 RepID=UPI0034D773DE